MDHITVDACGRLADKVLFTQGKKDDHTDDRAWGRLAINKKKRDGTKVVSYYPFVAWGAVARVLRDFTDTGKQLTLVGTMQSQNKMLPNGQFSNYTEIVAEKVYLGMDSQKNKAASAQPEPPSEMAAPQAAPVNMMNPTALAALAAALQAAAALSGKKTQSAA